MRPVRVATWIAGAALTLATTAHAAQRNDAIWARSTAGATITTDGVLDEPAWAKAESVTVWYAKENGIPGSGWKEEAGKLARDSTRATIKFLVNGNQLYVAFICPDSSVGGSYEFNRFDGLLMSIKDHTDPAAPAPPSEYFYSWWFPEDTLHGKDPGRLPCFKDQKWGDDGLCGTRTATQMQAWNGATKVHGLSSSDAVPDTGYTVELRFDLGMIGYDVTKPEGDIVEWNVSIYDADWYWPFNAARFSGNRAWIQSPWGNAAWYNELRIYSKPSVTINSGAAPQIDPDVEIPNAGSFPSPAIDGALNEAIWNHITPLHLRYKSGLARNEQPFVGKWRYGWYQNFIYGDTTGGIRDTADAYVRTFFKDDTLFLGFDVNDGVVEYASLFDRWDGFIITLTDRLKRYTDHNLYTWRMSFQVGPGGNAVAQDQMLYMRDTLQAARLALTLKPGTTVDTLGQQVDQGYQAEVAIDLTKLGYPHGLGDGWLFLGLDLMDGDSFTPFTDSYGTRTWWYRQYENECCPAWGYLSPNRFVPTAVLPGAPGVKFALIGNSPNPFHDLTRIQYVLPEQGVVTLEVFDISGRLVTKRMLGLQQPGTREVAVTRTGLGTGIYLYRLKLQDALTGAAKGTLSGKMAFLN